MGYFQLKKQNGMHWNERSEQKGLKRFSEFLQEEDGMGTVEIILIIVDIFTTLNWRVLCELYRN